MIKETIKGEHGDIKTVSLIAPGTIISTTSIGEVIEHGKRAILTISVHDNTPALSITIGNMSVFIDFNSDFPLLFKEGIKLYGSDN